MKKVLFVLETSGGSGQDNNRALIYRSSLKEAGVDATFIGYEPQHPAWVYRSPSFLADKLRKSLEYKVIAGVEFAALRSWNRSRILRASTEVDTVFLIKAASYDLVRQMRNRSRARLVYDLGDALWLPTFAPSYSRLESILKLVDAVTCDNRFGLDYARKFCKEVILWDPYPQIDEFDRRRQPKPSTKPGEPLVIGWLGSPGTLYNMYAIWEALEDLFRKHSNIRFSLVGAGLEAMLRPPFEQVRFSAVPHYTNEEMFDHVLTMDIGLFPMFDVENSKVRGILKALIYMSGEAAVVCSPRELCRELVRDGENGFLAETRSEWFDKLDRLVREPELRRRVTSTALADMRTRYPLSRIFGDLRGILRI